MPIMQERRPPTDMRQIRVVCGRCGRRLDTLLARPGWAGPDPNRPERVRQDGRRYPCDRCGANHETTVDRLDAAYLAAAAAPRADRVIRLPLV